MKYIDADRLRAEKIHFNDYFVKKSGNPADYGASNALAQVLPLIDSLQQEQPEVDLEKEIELYFDGWTNSPDYFQAINAEGECVSTDEIIEIARHFYELGKSSK